MSCEDVYLVTLSAFDTGSNIYRLVLLDDSSHGEGSRIAAYLCIAFALIEHLLLSVTESGSLLDSVDSASISSSGAMFLEHFEY